MPRELVIDIFAGGGGASEGITQALDIPVDIAVNHDQDAIEMHQVNHPRTRGSRWSRQRAAVTRLQATPWRIDAPRGTIRRPGGAFPPGFSRPVRIDIQVDADVSAANAVRCF